MANVGTFRGTGAFRCGMRLPSGPACSWRFCRGFALTWINAKVPAYQITVLKRNDHGRDAPAASPSRPGLAETAFPSTLPPPCLCLFRQKACMPTFIGMTMRRVQRECRRRLVLYGMRRSPSGGAAWPSSTAFLPSRLQAVAGHNRAMTGLTPNPSLLPRMLLYCTTWTAFSPSATA